jgi:hypothetical protein
MILYMKKVGHGSKLFKSWLNRLPITEGVEALNDYKLFKLCQPRVMAVILYPTNRLYNYNEHFKI